MANTRTYNPSVLVGNWFEDNVMKEEIIKNFMEKKENGQLLSQKLGRLTGPVTNGAGLSAAADGVLRYGDQIQLVNPGPSDLLVRMRKAEPRGPAALSLTASETVLQSGGNSSLPDRVACSGSVSCAPAARNVFRIVSLSSQLDGQPVVFGQPFLLATSSGLNSESMLYLASDQASFSNTAKRSRHQAVSFQREPNFAAQWRAEYLQPQMRLEFEMTPIPVYERIILKHVKTNQALSLEHEFRTRNFFGLEYEISSHTYYDDHKAETDKNHWMFMAECQPGCGQQVCCPCEQSQ